jgi:hypothetical protein
MKKIIKWFKGKKRRIAVISLAIANIDPEPYSKTGLVIIGVLLGGADLVGTAKEIIKNKEVKK